MIKRIFLLFFFTMSSSAFSQGNFGVVWVDTLNIGRQTPAALPLMTGAMGNVTYAEDEYVEEDKDIFGMPIETSSPKYDIDGIHQKLQQLVDKSRSSVGGAESKKNILIAGMSLIFLCGDKYEVVYEDFDERSPLAFVSGHVPKKYASTDNVSFLGASEDVAPDDLLKIFRERLSPSEGRWPPLAKTHIQDASQEWGKGESEEVRIGVALKEIQRAMSGRHESVPSLKEAVDKNLQDVIDNDKRNYGSAVDSEQYFLRYITSEREVLGSSESVFEAKYSSLLSKYKFKKGSVLQNKIEKFNEEMVKKIEETKKKYK